VCFTTVPSNAHRKPQIACSGKHSKLQAMVISSAWAKALFKGACKLCCRNTQGQLKLQIKKKTQRR